MADRLQELKARKDEALRAGGDVAIERQKGRGRLTARERIAYLVDEGAFHELEMLARHSATGLGMEAHRPYTDGVITGFGEIDGRRVCIYAQDFTVFGGALGESHGAKIQRLQDLAVSLGLPLISLHDGGGARIQEGVAALNAYGGIFRRNAAASGVIPQISVILGPCAGGAVYSPAMTDFTIMVKESSHMFITGPDVVRAVTGEEVTLDELAGATTHATTTGAAAFLCNDDHDALDTVRELLAYLPANNLEEAPRERSADASDRLCEELRDVLPALSSSPYDMKKVIAAIADDGVFLETHALFAPHILCGFIRIDGFSVGVVANQPNVLAGVLDIDASEKAARFVRTCDAFNIPLVTLVDVPGFLPGLAQEHDGIVRHGAKLLYAFCEASVPRVSIVLRKAYGAAYVVMNSKGVGADFAFAWPSAELAVMASGGAVEIVHRRAIAEAEDPAALRAALVSEYDETYANPYVAAERGFLDDIIDPAETRRRLAAAFTILRSKRESSPQRKHGNIPL